MKVILILVILMAITYNSFSQNHLDILSQKQRLWRVFHDSDIVREVGVYKNNKKEGPWLKYSKAGFLTDSVYYLNGIKVGKSKKYYENSCGGFQTQIVEYHPDSGMTIWGYWDHVYINKDSTYMGLYRDSTILYIECKCLNKSKGIYECTKYGNFKKVLQRRIFQNFSEAINKWDTPWK